MFYYKRLFQKIDNINLGKISVLMTEVTVLRNEVKKVFEMSYGKLVIY